MTNNADTNEIPSNPASLEDDEISLLDLALVLVKNKKQILGVPLAAGIVAAGVSLLMPNIYTATTKIMPPQQGASSASAMLAQLGGLAGLAGGAAGIKNPADMYISMMKSRTVAEGLNERFKLTDRFKAKTFSDVKARLDGAVKIASGKDGIITIEFDDEDPKFAADMANAYVEELYKLTNVLAVTEASQRRLFFERQTQQAKENLDRAQIAAKQGLSQGGVSNIDIESETALRTASALRAQISAKEVQIGSMRAFAAEQNPQLRAAQQELAALKAQLSKLEGHRADNTNTEEDKQRFDNLQRIRDVKYYETLYGLLAKQFEMAKIDEAKDAALIQVMDKAIEPDRKSKPKRALIVLLTMLATGFATVIWVFIREALNKAKSDPARAEQLNKLKAYCRW